MNFAHSLKACVACLILLLVACTRDKGELGTSKNPIKFFFVPSVESQLLEDSAKELKKHLEKTTPYHFSISVPASYVAVVEAFGSKQADVASLNTYGYVLAYNKYKVDVGLTVVRHGETTYGSAIIVRADSALNDLQDLNGKKVAFVDPTSTSGYLLPLKLFKDKNIKPKDTVFAQRHDNVISMVYQKQVDAGAIYYSPPYKGELQDARTLVKTQYPDVEEKIKIIALTERLPNDAIVFRNGLSEEIKRAIINSLNSFLKSTEGQEAFQKTFSVSGFAAAKNEDYESAKKLVEEINPAALR